MKKITRKIVKNGRKSYYINLPKEIVREIGWRERQIVTVDRVAGGVLIRDARTKKRK